MKAKKFCLAIVSSLVLYAVISVLTKTNYISNYIAPGRAHISGRGQFIEDGFINSNELWSKTDAKPAANTRLDYARVSPPRKLSQLGQTRVDITEQHFKYKLTLSPDWYAIKKLAEAPPSIPPGLDWKSIKQLETEASIANKLGEAVKRFPTTLIIGVKKGGTRALLTILEIHPQVKACGPEIHFFDERYPRGLQWYLSQMPAVSSGEQTIEKTPSYFVVQGVPKRVLDYSKAINKTLKFLVILRDPTVRAVSDYVQLKLGVRTKYNTNLKPFEKLLVKNHTSLEINTSWGVIKTGVYSKHLERWLRYFPIDWFHFVSGEELVRSPYEEIKKIENFLELKPYFTRSNFVFNQEKGFPCFRGRANRSEHCLDKVKGRAHPKVNPRILSELRRYYRPYNEQLYKMVYRNFQWP